MKHLKKVLSLCLALAMIFSLAACSQQPAASESTATPDVTAEATAEPTPEATPEETPEESETAAEPVSVNIAALKGPTAMGLIRLMKDADSGEATANHYTFSLSGSPDEVTPGLLKGELDMACVPANLAATLYAKTEGAVEVLAINTLGILYIVENGDTVHSFEDLKGQTIVASGKGTTPEYALRYLLSQNGIDPDNDVTLDWKNEHSECVTALASGQATIALLPQPFVTVAQSKLEGLRTALDLTEEWNKLDNGSAMLTGVIVARREVVEQNPAAVNAFLQEYAASVNWVNENTADAAALIGEYGIVDAAVAEKALPYCNIVCITSSEMKEKLSGYLQVLFDANPATVGGAMPEDNFYYGA